MDVQRSIHDQRIQQSRIHTMMVRLQYSGLEIIYCSSSGNAANMSRFGTSVRSSQQECVTAAAQNQKHTGEAGVALDYIIKLCTYHASISGQRHMA
jgi:hypothetical protein